LFLVSARFRHIESSTNFQLRALDRRKKLVDGHIKLGGNILQPSDHKPPRGTGPNLLRGLMGQSDVAPADHNRILARLEHGEGTAAPSSQRRGRIVASAAVMLALAGALGWTFYQNIGTPTLDMRSLSSDVATRLDSAGTGAAPAPVASAGAAPTETPTQTPNVAPPEKTAAAIVDEPPAIAIKAPAAVTTPVAPAAVVAVVASAMPHAPKPAATYTTPAAAKIVATPPPKGKGMGKSKVAPVPVDSDVTLLTALVAHANNQTPPPDVPPAASRDVVQGGPGEATASLLQRCKQLGLIEGMLCHARICSGRGDEPACK
jgi:hypothetical protein